MVRNPKFVTLSILCCLSFFFKAFTCYIDDKVKGESKTCKEMQTDFNILSGIWLAYARSPYVLEVLRPSLGFRVI